MGGPSSNSGGGPAGRTTAGTYGTKKDAQKASRKNEFSSAAKKVVDFVKGGGVIGALARGISDGVKNAKATSKDRKINDSLLGTSDYQGGVSRNRGSIDPRTGRDNNNQVTQKSIEQPKVKSQMNNTDVKSDLITAEAPAITEMTADEIALKNKRKGRKKTILTSVTGVDDYPTLSKKTLLG